MPEVDLLGAVLPITTVAKNVNAMTPLPIQLGPLLNGGVPSPQRSFELALNQLVVYSPAGALQVRTLTLDTQQSRKPNIA